jgi:hypothetical protein
MLTYRLFRFYRMSGMPFRRALARAWEKAREQ